MLHRRHRLAARFLAIGLLAATLSAADSLALPGTAEARCIGVGNPARSTFSYNGTVRVSETPATGTCNGNNAYAGTLKDESADGYCVQVYFMEAGLPWDPAAQVCGVGTSKDFNYYDINNNSRVYEQLCIVSDANRLCGWGSVLNDFATNYGY